MFNVFFFRQTKIKLIQVYYCTSTSYTNTTIYCQRTDLAPKRYAHHSLESVTSATNPTTILIHTRKNRYNKPLITIKTYSNETKLKLQQKFKIV